MVQAQQSEIADNPAPRSAVMAAPVGGAMRRRYTVPAVLGLILAVGLIARIYQLGDRPLWYDEAWSWRLIGFPFNEMITRIGRDSHPPLYYLLLREWAAAFGTSAVALRSLSVVFGLLTVVGMYLFTAEAFGHRRTPADERKGTDGLALFVAALVALSAFQIRFSWEVRMYALGAALAAFSSWALFRALRRDRLVHWLLYAVLALSFVYTHYYAFFTLAAQGVFAAGYLWTQSKGRIAAVRASKGIRYAALAAVVAAAGYLPWAPVFLRQKAQVEADFWVPPLSKWDVPLACYQMFCMPENPQIELPYTLVVAIPCGLGVVALLWRASPGHSYVFLAATMPFACSVVLSQLGTRVFVMRYHIFAHLFLLAALGVLVWRIPFRLERILVAGLVLLNLAWAHARFCETLAIHHRQGAKGAAEYIAAHRAPRELVVICSPVFFYPMLFHAPENRGGWKLYTGGKKLTHYNGEPILIPDDLIGVEAINASSAGRMWLVQVDGAWANDIVPPLPRWALRSEQRFREVFDFQGTVIVQEYERIPQTREQSGRQAP
jgi:uncharacterized membrane protein